MSCLLCLFKDFYQNDIQRARLYSQYIYKLRDLNLAEKHYTEAGFTLLLSAELLEWNDRSLSQDASCPPQREWERKEQHYIAIIDYFDRGQVCKITNYWSVCYTCVFTKF